MQTPILSREEIQALPQSQVESHYEEAVKYLHGLLHSPAPQNSLKKQRQDEIQAARLQYVTIRLRLFPDHFKNVVPATQMA